VSQHFGQIQSTNYMLILILCTNLETGINFYRERFPQMVAVKHGSYFHWNSLILKLFLVTLKEKAVGAYH
jgi:hypothetical protein